MSADIIACACGCGRKLLRFLNGRERSFISGHNGRAWTVEEEARLRELYPDIKTEKLVPVFGKPLQKIYSKAARLGLKKSAAFLASPDACHLRRENNPGVANRFKPGHVPANKGVKHPKGWAPGRMAETQFKPGQRGSRWVPIGSTRIVDGYRYTKVDDIRSTRGGIGFIPWTRNWKLTHVILWEKEHGKMPAHHALVFKNGDRTDIRLSNLKLVHRREVLARNSVHNLPKALKKVVMMRAQLVRKIRRLSA